MQGLNLKPRLYSRASGANRVEDEHSEIVNMAETIRSFEEDESQSKTPVRDRP